MAMDVNFALLTRVWCVAELVEADHLHIHQVSLKSRKCCQFPVRQGIVEKETNDILWDFVKVLGWLIDSCFGSEGIVRMRGIPLRILG